MFACLWVIYIYVHEYILAYTSYCIGYGPSPTAYAHDMHQAQAARAKGRAGALVSPMGGRPMKG